MTTVLLVAGGAAVGAVLRHLLEAFAQRGGWATFPWGTFSANAVGCFVAGFVAALVQRDAVSLQVGVLLGVGLCGALTTFSGFAYRTVEEWSAGRRALALEYSAASVAACLAAVVAGYAVGG